MRKLLAAACCVSLFLVLLVYQFSYNPNYIYAVQPESKQNGTLNGTKIILSWTKFFGESDWLPGDLAKLNCEVRDCVVTSDRKLLRDSAVLIFHWRDVSLSDLPENRQDQVWILYNKESPMHTPRRVLSALSDRINWTITYRRDSDFTSTYGRIERGKDSLSVSYRNRNSLIAWLVSNCDTPSKREDYVHELKRYIAVDIYGKCGKKYCPHISASQCYKKLASKYKFYLSFENSICKDYVTEKLFNAMKYGMVPIVFGGAEYKDILPPGSYIDTANYTSPKDLAEYLHTLIEDEEKYASFFEWREHFHVDLVPYRWLCNVCHKLHESFETKNRNLEMWWFEESNCRVWKDGTLSFLQ